MRGASEASEERLFSYNAPEGYIPLNFGGKSTRFFVTLKSLANEIMSYFFMWFSKNAPKTCEFDE